MAAGCGMATCDTRGKSSRGPAAGGGTRPVTGRRSRGVWPRRGLLPVTSRPARAQMTWWPRRALYPITARPSWWLRTITSVRTLWFHFAGAQSQAQRHRGLPANAQSSCPTVGRTESATVCGSPIQSRQYAGYRKFA